MAKIKFKQILSWGYKGIEVWNFLFSVGVSGLLRGALHSLFNGWTWYDQLLLFGGAALVILGILIFIFRNRRWFDLKTEAGNEQRELLNFYERQKANWKDNIRLRIVRVLPAIDGDVPKVVFDLEMINFLPIECRLIKVTHSSGTVNAGKLGSCALPSLPETIDERINACSEKQFKVEMGVSGTRVPDFLRPKLTEWGQLLQWTLKGEWYVEVGSKTEVWQYQGYEVRYDQVIARQ
jgi:hypothetical protein